jgi:hypothetical protein
MKQNWIKNIADLISGRVFNSLVSLKQRIDAIGEYMTANEQKLLDAAQKLNDAASRIQTGIDALKEKAEELEVHEDLSDEFAALDSAVASISGIGSNMTPAAHSTPASDPASADNTDNESTGAAPTPIQHEDLPAVPLSGSSGPTDAGVPTSTVPPGTGTSETEVSTTPVAEDATAEANPNAASTDTGATEGEPQPVADDSVAGGSEDDGEDGDTGEGDEDFDA